MDEAPEPHLELPAQLGRYDLLGRLGRGGMSTVYLGLARGAGWFGRLVAVKVLPETLRDSPEHEIMFLEEASLSARIHHRNVVATLDLAQTPRPYMVLEYVEGPSFLQLLQGPRIPVDIVVRIALDALAGLHAAHEARDEVTGARLGLIHRDVSPQNILVGTDGVARITDFGIAFAHERAIHTQVGCLKGKPSYWAPEQALGRPISRRTDVFALGIVLWEALTRRRLFPRQPTDAQINRILNAPIAPPSTHRPGLPAELDHIVMTALARDEAARWRTAETFAAALREAAPAVADRDQVARWIAGHAAEVIADQRALVRLARPILARRREALLGGFEGGGDPATGNTTMTRAAAAFAEDDLATTTVDDRAETAAAVAVAPAPVRSAETGEAPTVPLRDAPLRSAIVRERPAPTPAPARAIALPAPLAPTRPERRWLRVAIAAIVTLVLITLGLDLGGVRGSAPAPGPARSAR